MNQSQLKLGSWSGGVVGYWERLVVAHLFHQHPQQIGPDWRAPKPSQNLPCSRIVLSIQDSPTPPLRSCASC
jgi:hypothetical protein